MCDLLVCQWDRWGREGSEFIAVTVVILWGLIRKNGPKASRPQQDFAASEKPYSRVRGTTCSSLLPSVWRFLAMAPPISEGSSRWQMEFLGHTTREVACTLGSSPGWGIVEDTPGCSLVSEGYGHDCYFLEDNKNCCSVTEEWLQSNSYWEGLG